MSAYRASVVSLFAALVVLGAAGQAQEEVPSIAPTQLYEQQQQPDPPLVIDVRSVEEFRAGHLPGAMNIPHTQIAQRLDEIPRDRAVALYCMIGPRARLGEKALLDAGRTKLLHLEGGLAAWKEAGLPVEREAAP